MQDAFSTNTQGVKRHRPTTKGWEILVKWKDGSTTWIALKDMKESYPVQEPHFIGPSICMLGPIRLKEA